MNNEELKHVRDIYFNKSKYQKKILKEVKKNAISLSKNPSSKLMNAYKNLKSDDELVLLSFKNICLNTQESYNIMVYMGTYIFNNNRIEATYIGDQKAKYNKYIDLETEKIHCINIADVQDFENRYFVIYLPVFDLHEQVYIRNYYRLKKYVFRQLLNNTQEKVIEDLQDVKTIQKIFKKI